MKTQEIDTELVPISTKPTLYSLPNGWKKLPLDERGTGHTPDKTFPEYYNGGIKWISLADSDKLDNGYISETNSDISERGIRKSSAVLHPTGTIVLSRDAGVGKSAIMAEEMAVSQHFVTWTCGPSLHNVFLYYTLQQQKPLFERMAVGSTIKTIGLPFFKRYQILLPPLPEQRKIAELLNTWDTGIEHVQSLLAALKTRHRGLLQQLLTGQKRLPGFGGEWVEVPIGSIAKEVSLRNKADKVLSVLSCTKYDGLVDSLEYFGRKIFSNDLTAYKIIPHGTFAYATNHIEEGSIGYQDKYEQALISPMYTVFKTNHTINPHYLYYLLKTDRYIQYYRKNMIGSIDRRGGLRWNDFSKIKIPGLSISEQTAIARVLDASLAEVRLYEQRLAVLREQKRGLMQRLLTGQVRVKVEEPSAV